MVSKMKKISWLFATFVLLAGCAVSPQAVKLNPSVSVDRMNLGQGRSIHIRVIDKRPVKALGSRGGIYADTALLTIAGGPEEPIRQELAGVFTAYGFNVIDAVNADVTLTVEIEALGYQILGEKFPKVLKNTILLRAICEKADATFTSKYAANKEQEILITPTASQNERTINALVSRALNALIRDERLLKFLQE